MSRNADGLGRKPHKWRDRWRAYLTVGYEPNGDPVRKYVYGRTQKECVEKLEAAKKLKRRGAAITKRQTVADYLEEWLGDVAPTISPRTLEIYRSELAHVTPHLGRVQLANLTSKHIQRMMKAIVGTEVKYGRKGRAGTQTATLTHRSANAARLVLHKALADAVTAGLIPYNPAAKELVRPFREASDEIEVWTASEIESFLTATRDGGCVLHPFFYTGLTTGLRVGELGALEWRDVTPEGIHVRRTLGSDGTKTPTSRRIVPIAADTAAILGENRARLESVSPLVFPTSNGQAVTRSYARKSLIAWSTKAAVPPLSPHGLRHTFASMAIAAGMTAPELARILGHKSAAFTMKRYVHFFERAERREALTLAQLTGSANLKGVIVGGTGTEPSDVGGSE